MFITSVRDFQGKAILYKILGTVIILIGLYLIVVLPAAELLDLTWSMMIGILLIAAGYKLYGRKKG